MESVEFEEQIWRMSIGDGRKEEADKRGPRSDEGLLGVGIINVENEYLGMVLCKRCRVRFNI